jgi:hypothetical protein
MEVRQQRVLQTRVKYLRIIKYPFFYTIAL